MPPVVFQSDYSDPGMSTLKHALLYFGKLRIPSDANLKVKQLVKKEIIPQIEQLKKAAKFSVAKVAKMLSFTGIVLLARAVFPQTISRLVFDGAEIAAVTALLDEIKRGQKLRLESSYSVLLRKYP